ncbi:MAG TPA: hypothetical protein VGQ83_36040 [Polyangia bacterium]|jgi:hypothetical protein
MQDETRLYGVNLDELAEAVGTGDATYHAELLRRNAPRIAEAEKELTPGAVTEALRRWIYDPVAQVGEGAAGIALAHGFEILCVDAARRAAVPARLAGGRIPSVASLPDDAELLDVDVDFALVETRLTSRKTCGIVFQTSSPRVGHLTYRELRRIRKALREVPKERLAELPFFAAFAPAVRLAVRGELDLVAINF